MPRKPRTLVLDSWAVLAYLGGEARSQEVADLITSAHENREISEARADEAMADLTGLGIELIDADWRLARMAGTFKARHRMSYGDCFAAALAKDRKSDLVTGDREFRQVEGEVCVRWL
ncbi:MAG: PIN domain-containing protein [Betaproteobacteria bacterium]|nr:PIN domain-containing protein [Betaproteobacteria bacterium]